MNSLDEDQSLVAFSIIIAGILIAGSIIYSSGAGIATSEGSVENAVVPSPAGKPAPTGGVTSTLLTTVQPGEAVLGDPKAPLLFVEYGDYQCPFAGRFFTQLQPELIKNYVQTGKVRFVYRNYPFIGPESYLTSQATKCAGDQNKFWEYHDALFRAEIKDAKENNGNIQRDFLIQVAQDAKLSAKTFATCFDSKKYEAESRQDLDKAKSVGVEGTPTSFVNGEKFPGGAVPFEQYSAFLDKMLAQ
ncbi:MAG: DsbA family protein [Candidatus Liptonbacteria bacterium]|nr:DsbA family protein [Candidatus Liptonbacteria bacterium]